MNKDIVVIALSTWSIKIQSLVLAHTRAQATNQFETLTSRITKEDYFVSLFFVTIFIVYKWLYIAPARQEAVRRAPYL